MCEKIGSDEITIPVPLSRFEKFVQLEGRINTLVERYKHGSYLTEEDVLWAIGTEEAQKEAERRAEKSKSGNENE